MDDSRYTINLFHNGWTKTKYTHTQATGHVLWGREVIEASLQGKRVNILWETWEVEWVKARRRAHTHTTFLCLLCSYSYTPSSIHHCLHISLVPASSPFFTTLFIPSPLPSSVYYFFSLALSLPSSSFSSCCPASTSNPPALPFPIAYPLQSHLYSFPPTPPTPGSTSNNRKKQTAIQQVLGVRKGSSKPEGNQEGSRKFTKSSTSEVKVAVKI